MTTTHSKATTKTSPLKRMITKAHLLLKHEKPCKGPCHLLKIPSELRLKIYDFALVDHDQHTPTPPLLRTCRTIRTEGSVAYIEHLDRICEEWDMDFKWYTEQMHRLSALGRDEEAYGLYLGAKGIEREHEVAYMRAHWERGRMGREGVVV